MTADSPQSCLIHASTVKERFIDVKLSCLANDEAIAVFRMTDVDDVDDDTFDIRLALTHDRRAD